MAQKNFKKCQLGEVPNGGSARWGTGSKNLTFGRTIFFNFVGGKYLSPFPALNDLK